MHGILGLASGPTGQRSVRGGYSNQTTSFRSALLYTRPMAAKSARFPRPLSITLAQNLNMCQPTLDNTCMHLVCRLWFSSVSYFLITGLTHSKSWTCNDWVYPGLKRTKMPRATMVCVVRNMKRWWCCFCTLETHFFPWHSKPFLNQMNLLH